MTSEKSKGFARDSRPISTNVETDFSKTFCVSEEESCLEVKNGSRSVSAVEQINVIYTNDEIDEFVVSQVLALKNH